MTFSKNLITAVNKVVGFELFKTDETLDEATSRIEAMQPISEQISDNIQKLNVAVQENEEYKTKITELQEKVNSNEKENESIKSLLSNMKKDFSDQLKNVKDAIVSNGTDKESGDEGNQIEFPKVESKIPDPIVIKGRFSNK